MTVGATGAGFTRIGCDSSILQAARTDFTWPMILNIVRLYNTTRQTILLIERIHVRNLLPIALTMFVAAPALADSNANVATLAVPLTAKKEIIIGANMFRCEGTSCVLVARAADADTLGTCHALARKVGSFSAYVAAGKPFDADKLAKCNAQS
jgi:hypothetical protein